MSDFNDILHSIREIAREHEEPYKDGTWETFLKTRKKKKTIFIWPILVSGLAASLIIGFFAIPLTFNRDIEHGNLSTNSSSIEKSRETITETGTVTSKEPGIKKKTESQQIENGNAQYEKNVIYSITQNERHGDITKLEGDKINPFISQENEQDWLAFKEKDRTTIFSVDTIEKSNKHNELVKSLIEGFEEETPGKNKHKRLSLGFSVSPLLASNESGNNLGVSTGVQTDIPISRMVTINSGLTFAHQKVENVYKDRSSFSEPVSLTSRLISFDIPINFKIYLKKGTGKESYLLAGISSVGYLSERTTFTYQYEEVIEITTVSGGQEITTYQTILTERSVENTEPAFSTFDFAGFMNFSYGLKSPFSKKMHLTLEPYIKLPLSGLTTNNLRYTTGGVRLIISK